MIFNKYKEQGAYHWVEYGKMTEYGKHAVKVKKWVREGKTLDVGAGDGLITNLLGAVGIDNNDVAVKLANDKNVDVKLCSVYKIIYQNNSFDNVYFGDVIEHLETPDIAMKELKRILKPNGYLYVVTPPKNEKGIQDVYHYREYSPNEFIDYMGTFGFELIGEVEIINDFVRMYGLFKNKK